MGIATGAAVLAALLIRAWIGGPLLRVPPGAVVRVARVGYWQHARLPTADAAAVAAALGQVRMPPLPAGAGGPRPQSAPGAPQPAQEPGGPRYVFTVAGRRLTYDPAAATLTYRGRGYRLPPLAAAAFAQGAAAAERAFHGALVTWAEADRLFPIRSDATLVDLATGISFRVRRLAGSRHADVQPLTAADTAAMLRIYGGHWSWARRPILVLVDGRRLAASMNGMPHGAGSIAGNNFPGHFCVHFLAAEVHRSGRIDPGHLLAVLAAAGVSVIGPEPPPATPAGGC